MRCSRRSRLHKLGKVLIAAVAAATALSGLSVASPILTHAVADGSTGSGGEFVPMQGRILDTRSTSSIGGYSTPMPAGTWRAVQVTGQAGIPNSGVAAVAVNFSVVNDPSSGYLKADKDEDTPNSTISYMFWAAGQPQSNSGVIAVASDGKIQVKATSSTDLMIDVQGYYTAGDPAAGGFVPVPEDRLVDTRNGTGLPEAQLTSGSISTIQVGGLAGIPSDASAVVLNFLVENQSGVGNLAAYPADESVPQQYLHFDGSLPDPTSSAVALSSSGLQSGAIKVKISLSGGGTLDLVIDVLGYFTASQAGGVFTPAAARVYDSRSTGNAPLAGGETRTIQVAGVAGVPSAGLSAVAINVDIFDSVRESRGWTHVWPDDQSEPNPSMAVQYDMRGAASNLMTIALGVDGGVKIHNLGSDSIDIALDIEGWYSEDATTPLVESDFTAAAAPANAVDKSGDSCASTDKFDGTLQQMRHFLECENVPYQYIDEYDPLVTTVTDSSTGQVSSFPAPPSYDSPDTATTADAPLIDSYIPGAYDAPPPTDVDMLPNGGGPSCTWLMQHVAKICYHRGGIPKAMCYKWAVGTYYQWHCKPVAAYQYVNDEKLKTYVFEHFSFFEAAKACGTGAVKGLVVGAIWKLATGKAIGIMATAAKGCVGGELSYIFGGAAK